ncbi:MAG: hypothetical protein ACOYB0_09615 [Polynucleobacter sp.]
MPGLSYRFALVNLLQAVKDEKNKTPMSKRLLSLDRAIKIAEETLEECDNK